MNNIVRSFVKRVNWNVRSFVKRVNWNQVLWWAFMLLVVAGVYRGVFMAAESMALGERYAGACLEKGYPSYKAVNDAVYCINANTAILLKGLGG